MALIKCPECGKEISDKAPACIHCGFPLEQQSITEKAVNDVDTKLYKLILSNSPGDAKVKTIKLIRDIYGWGLAEAKNFVDTPPRVITTGLTHIDAKRLQQQFIDLGNSVDIEIDENSVSKVDIFSEMQTNEKARQEKYKSTNVEENKPKCPTCQSTNITKISGTKRWLSTGLFGLASSDVGKTMECKNCGYKW